MSKSRLKIPGGIYYFATDSLPTIDRVILSLSTQSASEKIVHREFIELQGKDLLGFNRQMSKGIMSSAKSGRARTDYGGGVIFKSEGYEFYIGDDTKKNVRYMYPMENAGRWGRMYSSIKNRLLFEVESGDVINGIVQDKNLYLVRPGFAIRRMFVETIEGHGEVVGRQFEKGEIDITQTLRLEEVFRK